MSLDFCCNIQMVGSEFGVKNMKAWIHPALSQGSGWYWWCNGVGDIFFAHLVPIEHRLNATVYLSIVADHVHPFMTTVYPSYLKKSNLKYVLIHIYIKLILK